MNILLTGGAGYIGSHTAVVLSQAGHEVVLLDNFCNSRKSVLERLEKILGGPLPCVEGDVCDITLVTKVLQDYKIDAVIHFAGLKAVGESVKKPIEYYANNVQGTICLLEAMKSTNLKTLVFSSSATVYGDPQYLPIDEDHPTKPMNPYGHTKLYVEQILRDLASSDSKWAIMCLRYFNPAGAHKSGLIGENPKGAPNNLIPYLAKVASGCIHRVSVYGNDYKTKDGTGERDYIHVMDLAEGHMAALNYIESKKGCYFFNLGMGTKFSVMEMIQAYQDASGVEIPYQVVGRRSGDIAMSYSDPTAANKELGWKARLDLHQICLDSWRFENLIT